nr:H490 [uncultured bacterium]
MRVVDFAVVAGSWNVSAERHGFFFNLLGSFKNGSYHRNAH